MIECSYLEGSVYLCMSMCVCTFVLLKEEWSPIWWKPGINTLPGRWHFLDLNVASSGLQVPGKAVRFKEDSLGKLSFILYFFLVG